MSHVEFVEQWPRFGEDAEPCSGTLRVEERRERMLETVCDACGFEVVIPVSAEARREWLLSKANLPETFAEKRFEATPESDECRRALRAWVRGADSGLLPAPALYGGLGTGKTHLLTLVCVQLVTAGHRVLFLSVQDWLSDMQAAFGTPARDDIFRRAVSTDVLALDDLGAHGASDWRMDTIGELVDRRSRAEAPILMTTNIHPARWSDELDPRTASRLMGMTFRVELAGRDWRQERLDLEGYIPPPSRMICAAALPNAGACWHQEAR